MKRRKTIDAERILYFGIVAAIVAVAIVCIVSAVKNEKNRITEGEVIDKTFRAAYSTTNENGNVVYHPAQYWLEIEGWKDGEMVQYSFKVPEAEYIQYQIGDWYGKGEEE